MGLDVHAGHGLDYKSTRLLANIKEISEFKNKKMHIDVIKEIDMFGDYKIILQKERTSNKNTFKEYSY